MRKEKWVRHFINMLDSVKSVSSCSRRQVGAILTNMDNEIVTTGFNGTPSGTLNCDEGGCLRCADDTVPSGVGYEYCLCVHAEHNAILSAAKQGKSVENTILYVSDRPCLQCLKIIVQCKIRAVYYKKDSVFLNANIEEIKLLVRKQGGLADDDGGGYLIGYEKEGDSGSPYGFLYNIYIHEVTDDTIEISKDYHYKRIAYPYEVGGVWI